MGPVSRVVTAVSLSALMAGGMSLSTVSNAAPTRLCGYPPGQCGIAFDKGTYFPRDVVHFRSGRAFRAGEQVDGVLHCRHNFRRLKGPWTAGAGHRAHGRFRLPRRTPAGTCTFTLVGAKSGSSASGSFTVKHHH